MGYPILPSANMAWVQMPPGPIQLLQGSNHRIKQKQPQSRCLTVLLGIKIWPSPTLSSASSSSLPSFSAGGAYPPRAGQSRYHPTSSHKRKATYLSCFPLFFTCFMIWTLEDGVGTQLCEARDAPSSRPFPEGGDPFAPAMATPQRWATAFLEILAAASNAGKSFPLDSSSCLDFAN